MPDSHSTHVSTTTADTGEQGMPDTHSSLESTSIAAEGVDHDADQHPSPETQSLLSDSAHTSYVTQHSDQAGDHGHEDHEHQDFEHEDYEHGDREHEDHDSTSPVVTQVHDGSSSDLSDQSPAAPHISADSATAGSPAAVKDHEQQDLPSDVDASDSLLQSENPTGVNPKAVWQATTMKTPLILCTLVLTLSFVAIVTVALTVSQARQGLMFAPRINELSFWKSFTYLYLPTLLSVLYGLYWSWIDLDVKRLQPYFQLGRQEGASGADSLLLEYPYQFVALVPYKAARHKHWPVLVGSIGLILATMFLTPFQAGLFVVRTVAITEDLASQYATAYTPRPELLLTI